MVVFFCLKDQSGFRKSCLAKDVSPFFFSKMKERKKRKMENGTEFVRNPESSGVSKGSLSWGCMFSYRKRAEETTRYQSGEAAKCPCAKAQSTQSA